MKFNAEAELQDDERRASQAVQHVAGAHHLLTILRDRLGVLEKHPELEEAITKLEMALSTLTVNTGWDAVTKTAAPDWRLPRPNSVRQKEVLCWGASFDGTNSTRPRR